MERKSDSKRVSVRKQPRRRVRRLGCLNFSYFFVVSSMARNSSNESATQ